MGTAASSEASSSSFSSSLETSNTSPFGQIGVWVVVGIAVLFVIGLFAFIMHSRSTKGRSSGCTIEDIPSDPVHISTENEHKDAMQQSKTIVVHHSQHCGYCQKFRPVVESVAKQLGYQVLYSEVSSSKANQQAFQTLPDSSGVPTICVQGKQMAMGYMPEGQLLKVLTQ